jgi:indoleamine 2,3-dioxygenase
MFLPIPNPADYGLSAEYGFLLPELPLEVLPQAYYHEWERVANGLHGFLLDGRLSDIVSELPTISTIWLKEEAERRRAFVLLTFILQAYA